LFWLFPLIFDLPQTVDFTTFIIFVNVLFAGKRLLESECHLARRRILPCFGMGAQAFPSSTQAATTPVRPRKNSASLVALT
jgi:hypothetical protein